MKKSKLTLLSLTSLTFLLFACNNKDNGIATQANIYSLNMQIQTLTDNQKQIEANKKLVADFYQEVFGNKEIAPIDKYIGDTYIQHNPSVADGKEALRQAVTQWFKGAPKEKIDIQHLSADGDLVYIHTKSKNGAKTFSVIDIFRVEKGKIVEHWDVGQEVPEKSANSHPMF
ncbi:MAG: nuclear transport factor 2 family protein [Chitinophagaceae bacterium]